MYEDVFYSPELRKAFHELFIIELYLTNNLVRMTLGITWKLYLWKWHWKSIGNCTCGNDWESIGNCTCGIDFGNQVGTVLVGMALEINCELYLCK